MIILDYCLPGRETSQGCERVDKTQKAVYLVLGFLSHRSHRKLNFISVVAYIFNSWGLIKILILYKKASGDFFGDIQSVMNLLLR